MSLLVFEDEPLVPLKVISGMQNGVDQAALYAAETVGIATGGMAPFGFKTLDGYKPQIAKRFNVQQSDDKGYPVRTEMNIVNSDATMQIAFDFSSAGETLTTRLVRKHNKPNVQIQVYQQHGVYFTTTRAITEMTHFLVTQKIRVLNVAGNSEKTALGIGNFAQSFLTMLFDNWVKELNANIYR